VTLQQSVENYSFDIQVSEDKMELRLSVVHGQSAECKDYTSIIRRLKEMKILSTLDDDLIKKICDAPWQFDSEVIAKGKPLVLGTNGYLKEEIIFSLEPQFLAEEDEDERIDYRQAIGYVLAKKGQCLGKIIPPVPAEAGYNIFGDKIKGEDVVSFTLNPGAGIEKKGDLVIATRNGRPHRDANFIEVLDVLEIRESVCMRTGNINYPGDVIIHGNVEDTFEVKASGNIKIKGTVGESQIISGANVTIASGVLGKEKCLIQAEGFIELKFAQNAILKSNGDILVSKDIRHCTVKCLGHLRLKNGGVIGGTSTVMKGIDGQFLGSDSFTKTIVRLKFDYQLDLLNDSLKSLFFLSTQIEEKNKFILENKKVGHSSFEQLKKDIVILDQVIKKMESINAEIDLKIKQKNEDVAYINVKKMIFPEVVLYAPNCYLEFQEERKGPVKLRDDVKSGRFV
jgi:uncharacterized protein